MAHNEDTASNGGAPRFTSQSSSTRVETSGGGARFESRSSSHSSSLLPRRADLPARTELANVPEAVLTAHSGSGHLVEVHVGR